MRLYIRHLRARRVHRSRHPPTGQHQVCNRLRPLQPRPPLSRLRNCGADDHSGVDTAVVPASTVAAEDGIAAG